MNKSHRLWIGVVLAGLLIGGASEARAQGFTGGFRGGITDDPDSIFFGGHLSLDLPRFPLRIEPSLQLGFGDLGSDYDFFSVRFDANFKFRFAIPPSRVFTIYPLIGLAIYYINLDDDLCGGHDCDDTEAGLNLGFGFEIYGIMADFIFGIDDIPEFTFLVGYTF